MKKNLLVQAVFILMCAVPWPAVGQPMSEGAIDKLVASALKAFDVPGIAVGIVKDGKVVLAKGYGVRSLSTGEPMNEHTRFGIASNTKAFTAAALGILVDEGKLGWDDKVIDYLPEFRLYDPYVTHDFTIRDLLTHRSGMGLGAGDLMIWPDGSDFTRAEIIYNLRYLKQVSPFRSKYDYDNNLYIVAGEVVAKISGLSWEDFIKSRILEPLGMAETAPSWSGLRDTLNTIAPHGAVEGKVQVIPRTTGDLMNAAGGIYSSVADLTIWVQTLLNKGLMADGRALVSKKVHKDLWTPVTLMPVSTNPPYNSHFAAYGLGFRLADVKGYLEVSHTGGLAGMVTQIVMYPELNLGIIVLTNQQVGAAFTAVTNQIKDGYFGVTGYDWVKIMSDRIRNSQQDADKTTAEVWARVESQLSLPPSARPDPALITGTYRDPWFGEISIEENQDKLWFRSKRSPGLAGELLHYQGFTYVAKWSNRSLDADAFVLFQPGFDGKAVGIKMKPISPLTDFSYDFQDLEFKRVQ